MQFSFPFCQGSHQVVREAFRREETNSRCEDESLKQYVRDLRGNDLDKGIVNNTGKKWHEQVCSSRVLPPLINIDCILKNTLEGAETSINPLFTSKHRFMMTTLREFGFGKSSMEEVINNEVEKFRLHLEKDDGSVVCVQVHRGEGSWASAPAYIMG